MRKAFYHVFLAAKTEEEDATNGNSRAQEAKKMLVEIRDWFPRPRIDPNNPWQIKKSITADELAAGKLMLFHEEMFDHVFRYWTLEMANHVIQGHRCPVIFIDYTDENTVKRVQGENMYLKTGSDNEYYTLDLMHLVRSRLLNPGDEIGLFWDVRTRTFGFKLLRRRGNTTTS